MSENKYEVKEENQNAGEEENRKPENQEQENNAQESKNHQGNGTGGFERKFPQS